MTVDPKKYEQGLRMAEWNCQNRGKLKVQKSESKLTSGLYYGIGAVVAIGEQGFLGYYVLLIQERKCDSGSQIQGRSRDFSSSLQVRNGVVFWATKWIRKLSSMTCTRWQS